MPQKLSLRWLAVLTMLTLSTAVLTCGRETTKGGPCSGVGIDHYNPRICVDDSVFTLPATPDHAKAANHQKPANGTGKVKIQWFAPGKHNISITVQPDGGVLCVEAQPTCTSGGICTATINSAAVDAQHPSRTCKYSISVPGDPKYKVNDPVVEVDVCCPAEAPSQ